MVYGIKYKKAKGSICDRCKDIFLIECLGVVAVSAAESMSFDDRIDHAARVIMTPSLILIWSFTDPIHPQVIIPID